MTISKKSIVILCVVCVIAFILGFAIGKINPSSSDNVQPQVPEVIESPSDDNSSSLTGENKFAYLIGNATMSNMKSEYSYYGFDDNAITDAMNNLIKGITDANEGIEVSEEESKEIEQAFRERIDELTKIIADKNIVIAQEFLDENKKREGVIETESGLQYEIIRQGGGTLAGENADVVIDYIMAVGNEDNVIDSAEDANLLTESLIKGANEGIALMNTGSVFKFYIPPKIGYGDVNLRNIPPNSVLIFTVTLKKINVAEEANK